MVDLIARVTDGLGNFDEAPVSITVTQPPSGIQPSPIAALNGALIFEDGFESNDFTKYTDLAPVGDPNWGGDSGGSVLEGAKIGPGKIIGTGQRSGARCWNAEVDPAATGYYTLANPNKAQIENWSRFDALQNQGKLDWCMVCRFFVPSDWPDVNTLIWQAKSSSEGNTQGGHNPISIRLRRGANTRTFALVSSIGVLNGTSLATNNLQVPLAQWWTLSVKFTHGKYPANGRIEAWFETTKIFDLVTPTSDGNFSYCGVGNYVAGTDWPVKCNLLIDDYRVTEPAV